MITIKIGSIWEALTEGRQFQVSGVKEVDNQLWVYYNNVSTKQEYSCLAEAFTKRFSEKINNG